MKSNAPEKIYINDFGSELSYDWHIEHCCKSDIEYTRTDVFIEKAQDFFRQSHHLFGLDGNELYHFIEDFRKYMKGE